MEDWKFAWHEGVAPELTRGELVALRDALRDDRPELVQGQTVRPPLFPSTADFPCEGACLIAYAGWRGFGNETVRDVNGFFRVVCFNAAARLGDRGEVKWLLEYWDATPRAEAVAALLPEVERALSERS